MKTINEYTIGWDCWMGIGDENDDTFSSGEKTIEISDYMVKKINNMTLKEEMEYCNELIADDVDGNDWNITDTEIRKYEITKKGSQ